MKNYMDVAILAAKEAGKIHKKYFSTDLAIKTKKTSFDLVTVADIEAEKKIVSVIRDNFSNHNFLGEEAKYKKTDSEYTWIIDPLDGTNNFAYRLPIFSCSIALVKDNRPIAGVVYDPTRDELFSAEEGKGARLNNQELSVTAAKTLKQSLLITGFYYNRGEDMFENLEKIKRFFLEHIIGLRRLGSAALDLCYVACGRASGFWEFELNPWDFAAGILIVKEAGGKVTGRSGEEISMKKSFIVASNAKIHGKMLEILK